MMKKAFFLLFSSIILLVVFSVFSSLLILRSASGKPASDGSYPYTIVEFASSADSSVEVLEEAGLGPIIWRETATIPISRVAGLEDIYLSSVDRRLEVDDLRRNPFMERLFAVFTGPITGGDVIFVPAPADEVERVLRGTDIPYFIHRDRSFPPYAGLIFWGITAGAMLIILKNRDWTLVVAAALLPFYFLRLPLFLSLLSILFISLRETALLILQGYRDLLNSEDGGKFPGTIREMPLFLYEMAKRFAPWRSMWSAALVLVLLGLSLIPGVHGGLLLLPMLIAVVLVALVLMYRHHRFTEQQEHTLFVARGITPSWDKPAKNERALLIGLIILALGFPFIFQVNTAPFPTRFISARDLGPELFAAHAESDNDAGAESTASDGSAGAESATAANRSYNPADVDTLLARDVIVLMAQRLNAEDNPGPAAGESGAADTAVANAAGAQPPAAGTVPVDTTPASEPANAETPGASTAPAGSPTGKPAASAASGGTTPGAGVASAGDAAENIDAAAAPAEGGADVPLIPVILLADLAYQRAFPYISIKHAVGAGRFEDGKVLLSRYEKGDQGFVSFDELVFQVDAEWVGEQPREAHPYSILRLYSDGERWYDVRPVSGVTIYPQIWNLVPELILVILLGFPWLGRWQFGPARWIAAKITRRRGTP